jgi:hypothetical protein
LKKESSLDFSIAEYTDVVVDNSISLVATITTTDELVDAWEAAVPA